MSDYNMLLMALMDRISRIEEELGIENEEEDKFDKLLTKMDSLLEAISKSYKNSQIASPA